MTSATIFRLSLGLCSSDQSNSSNSAQEWRKKKPPWIPEKILCKKVEAQLIEWGRTGKSNLWIAKKPIFSAHILGSLTCKHSKSYNNQNKNVPSGGGSRSNEVYVKVKNIRLKRGRRENIGTAITWWDSDHFQWHHQWEWINCATRLFEHI